MKLLDGCAFWDLPWQMWLTWQKMPKGAKEQGLQPLESRVRILVFACRPTYFSKSAYHWMQLLIWNFDITAPHVPWCRTPCCGHGPIKSSCQVDFHPAFDESRTWAEAEETKKEHFTKGYEPAGTWVYSCADDSSPWGYDPATSRALQH